MNFMDHSFKDRIAHYAQVNQWTVVEIDDEHAYLELVDDAGQAQVVEVFQAEDDMLVFAAPMSAGYPTEADMPHTFSTHLLRRNSELEIGYWCIEEINDELTYSCVAEVPSEDLDEDTFAEIASALVRECERVESQLDAEEPDDDQE